MSIILTAELVYKNYLNAVHYNEDEYNEKADKPVHRASMGGRCHRLQKYHTAFETKEVENEDGTISTKKVKKYQPKKLTEETMAVFRIGDVFHSEIQQSFHWLINEKNKDNDKIELIMENKIQVNMHGLLVEGHFDVVLVDHVNKVVQIVDLKTMNPRAMSFFKKDPYNKTGYIIQLGTYAVGVKEKYPDYDLCLLLSGWDKDKGNFHEVEIDVNRAVLLADGYYKELSKSMELEIDDIVPIQHPYSPKENWECNYCNYNHICPSPKIKRV